MTDPDDPLATDPLDALASAHLDGHTTGAEAARIRADATLEERVARMATARAALRSAAAPVDASRRDAAIAAALAAFDDAALDPADGASGGDSAPLTPITAAASRRVLSRRTLGLVGAAAVAVLVALAVPLLGRLDSDRSDDDVAATTLEASTAEGVERDASAGAGSEGAQAPGPDGLDTFAAAGEPVDLGSYADLLGLQEAVRPLVQARTAEDAEPSTTSAGTPPAGTAADTCGASPERTRSRVLVGRATLDERPVLVFVYEREPGAYEIVIVDPSDCSTVTSATFR